MTIKLREPAYRDIRQDLKARMISAAAKRDEYQKQMKALDDEVLMLTKLLDQEESRFGSREPETTGASETLSTFILESLARGRMNKDGLRNFAESQGLVVDGRSLHATIINLVRSGKVKQVSDGFYDLP
ncbi:MULTISPECIES: hypothetical protein [unclassified Bradyrhizobium]